MAYWLLKTEPGNYSFADLEREGKTAWDGVRNYQARNNLRSMMPEDLAFIYHSVGPREVVGIAKIISDAYPDATAHDGDWSAVDIVPVQRLAIPIPLQAIKAEPRLKELSLVKQSRLSVCPVSAQEWQILLQIGGIN